MHILTAGDNAQDWGGCGRGDSCITSMRNEFINRLPPPKKTIAFITLPITDIQTTYMLSNLSAYSIHSHMN